MLIKSPGQTLRFMTYYYILYKGDFSKDFAGQALTDTLQVCHVG